MGFWSNMGDWVYEITDPIDRAFKFVGRILFRVILVLFRVIRVLFILSIVAGFIYVLYWIIKAILGFIKYYSQFA
jgi:hypothetical protein